MARFFCRCAVFLKTAIMRTSILVLAIEDYRHMAKIIPQSYPRSAKTGLLDDGQLVPHPSKIDVDVLKSMIVRAINLANQKSSREMLALNVSMTEAEIEQLYHDVGHDLFKYFRKYSGDPASSAHQNYGKHYRDVAVEQFRNRMVQKGRMNSGWRYQYLAVDCARESRRFRSVSDIGAAEADFNAVIDFIDPEREPLNLYVSVKNRRNTMGGQDWPKAIYALEQVAQRDKNRVGPYCCVFGIAMDKGQRSIKHDQKTGQPHSPNTEVWLSDYFWPFFSNYTYEEIMLYVLEVLIATQNEEELVSQVEIPEAILSVFGQFCHAVGLLDDDGYFHDAFKLVKFFVGSKDK